MKLDVEPSEVIERFRMAYMNETRECIFQKGLPKMVIGGKEIGPYENGQQISLPNWIVEKLVAKGIATLSPDDQYESMAVLQKLYQDEKRGSKLQDAPPLLYVSLAQKIARLQSDRTSLDQKKIEDIERVERILSVMIETRLSKVIQIAKSGAYGDKRREMTVEERWLCERLIELLSTWRQSVRKSV